MAAEDYYGDGETEAPARPGKEPEDKEESTSQTALIPKALFPGKECKPGEKLKLEVVAVHEDEIEVKGAGYEKDDDEEDEPEMERKEMPMRRERQMRGGMSEMME